MNNLDPCLLYTRRFDDQKMANFNTSLFNLDVDPSQPVIWDAVLDYSDIENYNHPAGPETLTFAEEMGTPQQRIAEFYGSLHSPGSTSPASASDISSSRSRSTDLPNKAVHSRQDLGPGKAERRREQNRQSQRAYRDRKEKHQRDLEGQIAMWKEKHEKLSSSFAARTKEVSQLKAQIEHLNTQIFSLQAGVSQTCGEIDRSQQDFDLVPFYNNRPGS